MVQQPPGRPTRNMVQRELHVEVWEQPESSAALHAETTLTEPGVSVDEPSHPLADKSSFIEEGTSPLPSVPPRNPQVTQFGGQAQPQQDQRDGYRQSAQRPMHPYPGGPSAVGWQGRVVPPGVVQPGLTQSGPIQPSVNQFSQPMTQRPPRTPQPPVRPGAPPVQGRGQQVYTPPPALAVPPMAAGRQGTVQPVGRGRAGNRGLLVLVGCLLFLLVAGGLAAWVVVFHPFAVPEVTQPQQDFQNADLGIALQYPRGWIAQVDKKNQTIHLYDSNHTDQVNIVAVAANGADAGQYLQKETSRLGMTALKAKATVAFGGASWQEVRGNVVLSGASYAETLFVTLHNGRFFSMMQLAPQTTYDAEEQVTFAAIRTSFKFLT